jgi:hypothetical protein
LRAARGISGFDCGLGERSAGASDMTGAYFLNGGVPVFGFGRERQECRAWEIMIEMGMMP